MNHETKTLPSDRFANVYTSHHSLAYSQLLHVRIACKTCPKNSPFELYSSLDQYNVLSVTRVNAGLAKFLQVLQCCHAEVCSLTVVCLAQSQSHM